jgi:hypothetical protein
VAGIAAVALWAFACAVWWLAVTDPGIWVSDPGAYELMGVPLILVMAPLLVNRFARATAFVAALLLTIWALVTGYWGGAIFLLPVPALLLIAILPRARGR